MFHFSMFTPLVISSVMMTGDRCWGAFQCPSVRLKALSLHYQWGKKICANPSFVKMHAAGSESFYVFM